MSQQHQSPVDQYRQEVARKAADLKAQQKAERDRREREKSR